VKVKVRVITLLWVGEAKHVTFAEDDSAASVESGFVDDHLTVDVAQSRDEWLDRHHAYTTTRTSQHYTRVASAALPHSHCTKRNELHGVPWWLLKRQCSSSMYDPLS